ncbi:hypothetical protein CQS04_10010 [Chryseomicrobium excrementi]|uniref:Guanylate cyclase domain-containing protein n=1 Tax=Chryseomicrobium excrementi TaxID=2041346 RepID=A0A2M9EYE6_9BACL|nr:adenylate/guanylate cyclase domain-containing protein [Chryseomicrobium excrementi]PJK16235.1 hypothetical protein CQS04_10010 [Chryseomicrobium excrementi]
MGTIIYEEQQVIDLPLEAAWEMATDTNHFNHYAKLFHVQFSPLHINQGDVIREAKANVFGIIPTKWREYTFSWVRNEWFEIERIYLKSPMKRALWKISLEAVNERQTRMRVDGDFNYANFLGKVALERVVIPQLRGIFRYAEEYAASYDKQAIRPQAKQRVTVQQNVLDRRAKALYQLYPSSEHVEPLLNAIQNANDEDVTGMQPYKWASQQGMARREALELFLLATKAGLLQQRWSMLCPNCRVPKQQSVTLRDIQDTVHCDLCGIDYTMDFDRSIEMQFDVDPAIRTSAGLLYCVNGPMNSTHILAQFRIPANSTVNLQLPKWEKAHRYRILQWNHVVQVDDEGEAHQALEYTPHGFNSAHIQPTQHLSIQNQCEHEIVFMVEELEWNADALTARELTSLQVFRDLFATEVLSPDQEIQVGQLTVLFTDLKESTAMYERIGDALAYSDVRQHFDYLKHQIRKHDGTIVKTIGDAVMAVFTDEQNAFDAALAIQQGIGSLTSSEGQQFTIKMGMHQGTVIAVNANDLLDYFGRTVNLAARVQQLSLGQDLVMTAATYQQLDERQGLAVETFHAPLKGIGKDIELVRISVPIISREIVTASDTA